MSPVPLLAPLERLPLLKALFPFMLGLAAARCLTLPGPFLLAALGLTALLAALFRSPTALCGLLLTAGFGRMQLAERPCSLPRGVTTLFKLRVDGLPVVHDRYTAVDAVATAWRDPTTGHWLAAGDRVRLYVDSLTPVAYGDRLCCRARLKDFRSDRPQYRQLMHNRGFVGTLWTGQSNLLRRDTLTRPSLHLLAVQRIRRLGLAPEAEGLARALAAGDRSLLTAERRDRYARSGCAHLLAVSGMHTTLFFGLIQLLLWALPLFRHGQLLRCVVATAALWLFVAATGASASAVRAGVMCTLAQVVFAGGTPMTGLHTLAFAAFAMLACRPEWIADAGFQLSFLAVAAILVWGVPLKRRLHSRRWIVNWLIGSLAVALTAGAATAPLAAHLYGFVPWAGILLNIAALPPAFVLLGCGVLAMLLPAGAGAALLGRLIEGAAAWLEGTVNLILRIPHATFVWRPDTLTTGLIYAALLLLTLLIAARQSPPRV